MRVQRAEPYANRSNEQKARGAKASARLKAKEGGASRPSLVHIPMHPASSPSLIGGIEFYIDKMQIQIVSGGLFILSPK